MAKAEEKDKILRRTYTIPLRSAFRNAARNKKTARAVRAVRAFLQRHMKSDDIRIGQHLNAFLWARGIQNPPPRVVVTAIKDQEGVVRAALEGKEFVESVKPTPKDEEPETLKEKLESTIKKKPKKEENKKLEVPKKEDSESVKEEIEDSSEKKDSVKKESVKKRDD